MARTADNAWNVAGNAVATALHCAEAALTVKLMADDDHYRPRLGADVVRRLAG